MSILEHAIIIKMEEEMRKLEELTRPDKEENNQ